MSEAAGVPDPDFQALVRKQYAGNPQAMTELGARLLVGRDAPQAPVDGAALIAEAAQQGDPGAWRYVAVIAAAGVGRAQSWPDAFDAIQRAAESDDTHAKRQLGNFPQAFSHVALVNTARILSGEGISSRSA